jgi:hypothetical protein
MQRSTVNKYRKHMQSILEYTDEYGIKIKPYPQIKLNTEIQKDDVFGKTGYYDPESKTIVIFVAQRFCKDCLRSFCHELIHHNQNLEGRLSNDAYEGDKIINDERLKKLEEEAYLKGNILFRSWTEKIQDQEQSEPTEHTRKLIKLNEDQIKQILNHRP